MTQINTHRHKKGTYSIFEQQKLYETSIFKSQ